MDALGVMLMGVGAFLVYAAVKGEHPWTAFTGVLKSSQSPRNANTTATTPAALPPGTQTI